MSTPGVPVERRSEGKHVKKAPKSEVRNRNGHRSYHIISMERYSLLLLLLQIIPELRKAF